MCVHLVVESEKWFPKGPCAVRTDGVTETSVGSVKERAGIDLARCPSTTPVSVKVSLKSVKSYLVL